MQKQKIVMKNWAICSGDCDGYQAPETRSFYLRGNVYGDTRRSAEGNLVNTSEIVEHDDAMTWAKTKNGTVYNLESMDLDYAVWLDHYMKAKNENSKAT